MLTNKQRNGIRNHHHLSWPTDCSVPPVTETILNIIISFAGLETKQNATPYALRRIAGSTILGHILVQFLDLPLSKLVLILDSAEQPVQEWLRNNAPDLAMQILLAGDAANPIDALNSCKAVLDSEPLLFISGNFIADADYLDLVSSTSDVSCLVQSEQDNTPAEEIAFDEAGSVDARGANSIRWAGACWFQHGTDLIKAFETAENQNYQGLGSLLAALKTLGLRISTKRAAYCLETRSVENMLYANARLLRLNHGTQDAIERSYAEDFTVLPPVFLHETAVIENSVIGPFVNLEANASVRNSIVRNSLIGTGTQISAAVLDDSQIGDNAIITGQSTSLNVDDGAIIEIGTEHNKISA